MCAARGRSRVVRAPVWHSDVQISDRRCEHLQACFVGSCAAGAAAHSKPSKRTRLLRKYMYSTGKRVQCEPYRAGSAGPRLPVSASVSTDNARCTTPRLWQCARPPTSCPNRRRACASFSGPAASTQSPSVPPDACSVTTTRCAPSAAPACSKPAASVAM